MFITSLERREINPGSHKDFFAYAIKNVTFWTLIFRVKGKQEGMLKMQSVYSLMRKAYTKMYTDLQNDQYDYTFLKKLTAESKEEFVDVFLLVVDDSKPQILETWEKALNFAERACKEIDLMIRVCSDVSSKLPCSFRKTLLESVQYLKETKEKFLKGQLTLCGFNDLAIFKHDALESEKSLLQSCKDVEQFISINSFWKSIDVYLGHHINEILVTKRKQMMGELTTEREVQILLGFISTDCVSNFRKSVYSLVFEDIPISQLFHMFWEKEMSIKNLSVELNHIIKIIGLEDFPGERKHMIMRCLRLNLNLKKISAVRKFQSIICSKLDERCIKT